MSRRATKPAVAVTEAATRRPVTVPNLAELCLGAPSARRGAPTGEFYALPPAEADEAGRDAITLAPIPAGAERDAGNATFRLPFPELAPKNADGSYKYRVYDAAWLWGWVCAPGRASDPLDRTPLLRRDWEELRDRYSSAAAHPTSPLTTFRAPITTGLWPPGVPYVPPPPPPPLTDATIRNAVEEALTAGGPEYVHPGYGPIAGWDVGAVTNMRGMFRFVAHVQGHAYTFNGDLSRWDVRNVTDMDRMFMGAAAFNGDLSRWKVGAVTDMSRMFARASTFNGDLSRWDVSNVTQMDAMFRSANAFNGDLSRWKVGAVTNMHHMFSETGVFNGDLKGWDVRNVKDMSSTFENAAAFNGDLSRWDVRNVIHMGRMFHRATAFNGDLSSWRPRNVMNMYSMFEDAYTFNGDLKYWDVRNVKDMSSMFEGAAAFNGDLSRWDVRNVTEMDRMFDDAVAYRPEHELGTRSA